MAKKKEPEHETPAVVPTPTPPVQTTISGSEPVEAKVGKPCVNCGKKIASRATSCPFCSTPQPLKEKKEGTGTRRTASHNSSPTLDNLKQAKSLAEEKGETVSEFLATVEEVLACSEDFGSVENLRDCLSFLVEMGAK